MNRRYVVDALRCGRCVPDASFDQVYPPFVRDISLRFWTPVAVALTAANWLQRAECRRVLDVGAGVGKFCIATSLASDCTIRGIEHRRQLVDAAQYAGACYDAEDLVEHGTIENVDAAGFSGFYFYNPFGENHYSSSDRLDDLVELSEARCLRDLATTEAWLDRAKLGTCALTYHGFGGRIPDTYDLVRRSERHHGELRLWRKNRNGRARGFNLELGECVVSSAQLEVLVKRLSPSCRLRVQSLLDRPFD